MTDTIYFLAILGIIIMTMIFVDDEKEAKQ